MGQYDAQKRWRAKQSDEDKRARWKRDNDRRRQRVRDLLMAAKSAPCTDCGRDDLPPECMDLDHVRGVKRFALTVTAARPFGLEAIKAEIAKCDPRCPTCHRLRHHRERAAD